MRWDTFFERPLQPAQHAVRVAPAARAPVLSRGDGRREPPIETCAASAHRRCRSCCAWPRAGALARVLSLLALDFVGVALAIFTALVLKAAVLGDVDVSQAFEETRRILAFAYLVTALLFARSGLYAERSQRPGLSRIVGALFQVAFVALLFAVVSGEHFSSFYIFYGSLAFALLYVSSLRGCLRVADGSAAARRRLSPPRACSWARASTSATSPTRSATRRTRRSRSSASSRRTRCPPTALRSLGSLGELPGGARHRTDRRGDHRRPGLPAGRGRGAGRPLPPARGARAAGAVDDGDPDPPRRVRAGPVGAAVRARARRCSRASTSR